MGERWGQSRRGQGREELDGEETAGVTERARRRVVPWFEKQRLEGAWRMQPGLLPPPEAPEEAGWRDGWAGLRMRMRDASRPMPAMGCCPYLRPVSFMVAVDPAPCLAVLLCLVVPCPVLSSFLHIYVHPCIHTWPLAGSFFAWPWPRPRLPPLRPPPLLLLLFLLLLLLLALVLALALLLLLLLLLLPPTSSTSTP